MTSYRIPIGRTVQAAGQMIGGWWGRAGQWCRPSMTVVAIVVMVVAEAAPAGAAPIYGSATILASSSSISLGDPNGITVSWSFQEGSACRLYHYGHSPEDVQLMYRDWTTGLELNTGLTGSSGSGTYTPPSSGTFFLSVYLECEYPPDHFTSSWQQLGGTGVTVTLPGTVEITDPSQNLLFAQAIATPNTVVRIAGEVELDLSGMRELQVESGVQVIGDRTENPLGPRLFTTTFPYETLLTGQCQVFELS